ncbi:signal recognition particle-docking protein FtsY [Spiroplasma turonicum]|uniref:Signal recognition particle receptor FtsY n=1 Tax=Spiroplasma turonicum TaxID=216946 RepID=A0A0K1P5J0_9MOLU|nr:signal recognition particle-docking protein FtsY [Spiroplasma turonicum]AKU79444.1 signal recognition particle-docking protein FtsY [Spiroplasma turonicum]ALX70466.1 signal recognition particle-docking protein FtsY [Spiroplasma turonicum]
MGFWSILKERRQLKKQEKKHKKEHKNTLTFSSDIKKLTKKYKTPNSDFYEELENVLIKTDMGMKMVLEISNNVQKKVKPKHTFTDIKEILAEEIYKAYIDSGKPKTDLNFKDGRLNIFLIVGVNGVGKTTSIAKIANFYSSQNKKVLIAAGDTFRAGAVEQLEQWCNNRLKNVDLVKPQNNTKDPASVVFDSIKIALEKNYDILLVDTAGRLQNKEHLMRELEKITKIIQKSVKDGPHERLLVIDAQTGQNGVNQAKAFSEATDVTGIVLTKMDGTSKGGIAMAIKDILKIPVKLIGTGEKVEDLKQFNVDEYIYEMTADFMEDDEEND